MLKSLLAFLGSIIISIRLNLYPWIIEIHVLKPFFHEIRNCQINDKGNYFFWFFQVYKSQKSSLIPTFINKFSDVYCRISWEIRNVKNYFISVRFFKVLLIKYLYLEISSHLPNFSHFTAINFLKLIYESWYFRSLDFLNHIWDMKSLIETYL